MSTELDVTWIEERLREAGTALGLPLHLVAETGSTNVDAREAASRGAGHGSLFLADAQTAGRGRLGRRWYSPPGANLYFSIVLHPGFSVTRLPSIALVAGLAVAEAIDSLVPEAGLGLKWPNDVMLRGKKLAGILVEGSMCGDRCEHVIVGIGVNVHQTQFEPEIQSMATSLASLGATPTREQVLVQILGVLSRRYAQFERSGLDLMIDPIRARDVVKGRRVRVGAKEGVADGIAPGGELLVRLDDGAVQQVHAGDMELLPAT